MHRESLSLSIVSLFLLFVVGQAGAITLREISTPFNSSTGIDYHEPTDSVVLSVNFNSGEPHNFERILSDGTAVQFSNISGFIDEVKIAAVRSSNTGGFTIGDLFTGNGVDGQIARITEEGATVINPFVDLPGANNGLMQGSLYLDQTGIYGGELIVTTSAGEVWRADSAGNPTFIADVNTPLEGVITVPNNVEKYGPLAGTIIAGAEQQDLLYVFDNDGFVGTHDVGVNIEDIDLILPNENFFGVNYGTGRLGRRHLQALSGAFPFIGNESSTLDLNVIPEPSTAILTVLGLSLLWHRRRYVKASDVWYDE